jgi:uncharacterized protein
MKSVNRITRRKFISAAAATAGASVLPGHALTLAAQDPVVDAVATKGKSSSRERVGWNLEPFPLQQVRLLEGPFKVGMETNIKWMLSLPSDRLLHTFRITAGLPSSAQPLGGWEKPDCELRGHFTGHFLSACALTYASTGDEKIKTKANEMVAELAQCQRAHKDGYLSAFPEDLFGRLRTLQKVWAPFYTYHKIMAGHLDMYLYCGNQQALATVEGMAGWVSKWHESISDEHMQRILQTEYGGMNEVLCNLYAVTGKPYYLDLAALFEKKMFFDPLAAHRDELKGLHANTHIPQVIGAARRYELTGEQRYRTIASYFWDEVTSERSYCTGGTSNEEHWRTDPGKLASELDQNTEECCCAYNMLKLTRHIFGWTADPRAMDYYERTLFNHRLGTQDGDGLKSYFLPLGSGYWKYFNTPYDSFWCCTGTGVEEFAKFGDTIYFHDDRGIFVNLFIPSELEWPEKRIRLRQETRFPEEEGTNLVIRTENPTEMAVRVRVPYWATRGGTLKLNGTPLPVFASPSSYLTIDRVWKDGDRIEVSMPMSLHIETIPDDSSLQAAMYGPLVLACPLGSKDLTPAMTYIGYDTSPGGEPGSAPQVKNTSSAPASWVEPVSGQVLTFRTVGQAENVTLVPLYKLFGERYAVYWKVTGKTA